MSNKTPIYNSINDVPVDHLEKIRIHRSRTLLSTYDVMSIEQFLKEIEGYDIKNSSIEIEKEHGYYGDVDIMVKLNYSELESDKEFNIRVQLYKKEQFNKYSVAAHEKNRKRMTKLQKEKEANELALYKKLQKKYKGKIDNL